MNDTLRISISEGFDTCETCGGFEWWSVSIDGKSVASYDGHLGGASIDGVYDCDSFVAGLKAALDIAGRKHVVAADSRKGWHYDSQGYCDNPGRGY